MDFRPWIEAEWGGFPHRQQKLLPFMQNPENPYMRKFVPEEPDEEYQAGNLYHVTTALSSVKRSEALKSRGQLNNQNIGLGGGWKNEASSKISLTYSYPRAVELYEEFQFVASIIKNKISASEIYNRMSNHSSYHFDAEEKLSNIEKVAVEFGISKKAILNGGNIDEMIDKKINTPEEKYKFFQGLEQAIVKDYESNDYEGSYSWPVMGFTADFYHMKNLNPQEIAIIQCVIRKNAVVNHQPQEIEIRVNPADVAVVRYLQPKI